MDQLPPGGSIWRGRHGGRGRSDVDDKGVTRAETIGDEDLHQGAIQRLEGDDVASGHTWWYDNLHV